MMRCVFFEECIKYWVPYVLRECIDLGERVKIFNRTETGLTRSFAFVFH